VETFRTLFGCETVLVSRNSAVLRNHVRPIAKFTQFITRERLWRRSESTASHIESESRGNGPSNVVLERFWADPCSTDHPFGKYNMAGCPTQRVVQPVSGAPSPARSFPDLFALHVIEVVASGRLA
jgi:hypothetical protein